MRVLRIFHGGGVVEYQNREAALVDLGHSVRVLVPRVWAELPTATRAQARDVPYQVRPIRIYGPRQNPWFTYSPRTIRRHFAEFRAELLDLHEEPYSLAAASALLGAPGVPLVFRSSQNELKRYPLPFRRLEEIAYNRASAAYVPSPAARDVLMAKGFSKPIAIVPNGVSLPSVAMRPSANPPVVVFAGRLTERKGVRDLIRASEILGNKVSVIVIGAGPLRPEVEAAHAVGLLDYVGPTPIDEVGGIMLAADMVVAPSHQLQGWSEQFCRSVAEGMAHYCAPVVSDSGALPWVAGAAAAVFPAGSPEGLASAIIASLEGLDERRSAARERAASLFGWGTTSQQIAELYEIAEGGV